MYCSLNQERLIEVLKFLLIFNLMAAPLYLITSFQELLYPLQVLERDEASFILFLFSVPHERVDFMNLPALMMSNGELIVIGEACTAWRSILAFTALVIASPRSWSHKRKALIGAPIIYLANLIRIAFISFIALIAPQATELVHTFLWREGLMFIILLTWYYWFTHSVNA